MDLGERDLVIVTGIYYQLAHLSVMLLFVAICNLKPELLTEVIFFRGQHGGCLGSFCLVLMLLIFLLEE